MNRVEDFAVVRWRAPAIELSRSGNRMAAHRGSWAAVAPLGEQALQAALSERCARFQPSPYASDAVAFTHLPKAGGSSYQRLLRESGAGKRICNVHDLPLAELAASQQAGRRFKQHARRSPTPHQRTRGVSFIPPNPSPTSAELWTSGTGIGDIRHTLRCPLGLCDFGLCS